MGAGAGGGVVDGRHGVVDTRGLGTGIPKCRHGWTKRGTVGTTVRATAVDAPLQRSAVHQTLSSLGVNVQ